LKTQEKKQERKNQREKSQGKRETGPKPNVGGSECRRRGVSNHAKWGKKRGHKRKICLKAQRGASSGLKQLPGEGEKKNLG